MTEKGIELVRSALIGFNLSDVESTIYTTVLNLGTRPAATIAKHAGLNRTYTYDLLSSLTRKGLVREVEKNKVRHYSCAPPQTLVDLLESREKELAGQKGDLLNALPLLQELQSQRVGDSSVRYFQGINGIEKVYKETLSTAGETIYGFLDSESYDNPAGAKLRQVRKRYHSSRTKKDIWYHAIANESSYIALDFDEQQNQKLKIKMLHGINLPVEIIIYQGKIAILSAQQEKLGIVVDNSHTSSALQSLHQSLWRLLSELS